MAAVNGRGGDDFGEVGTAVGEGAGFVEDERSAGVDAFEESGILDDDGAAGGEGDGSEDGDGDGDEEGAGGGDDEDGEEAAGVAAEEPAETGDGEGERGVPTTEAVGEAAHGGAGFFGLLHDLHDLGVARVNGEFGRFNLEDGVAVDGSGQDRGAGELADAERFTGEEGFVHGAAAIEDRAVDGTGFVGEDDEDIADGDLFEGDIDDIGAGAAMGDAGHAFD